MPTFQSPSSGGSITPSAEDQAIKDSYERLGGNNARAARLWEAAIRWFRQGRLNRAFFVAHMLVGRKYTNLPEANTALYLMADAISTLQKRLHNNPDLPTQQSQSNVRFFFLPNWSGSYLGYFIPRETSSAGRAAIIAAHKAYVQERNTTP